MGEQATSGHRTCDVLHVVVGQDGFRAGCGCGWTSATGADGRDIGQQWDQHRGERAAATSRVA